jgi:CDP-glycerol glycerophosphotransferase
MINMMKQVKKIFKLGSLILKTSFVLVFFIFLKIFFFFVPYSNNIWLVSERGYDANDNGLYFYQWLLINHPEIESRYLIKKNSSDFVNLPKSKGIIFWGSFHHYLLLFKAKIFISTHINTYIPFTSYYNLLEKYNLFSFSSKKVFLQHGIIKDNLIGLHYPNIKVDLFITGAKKEFDFVKKTFHHPKNVVVYTGLARFDKYHFNTKEKTTKIISIIPTWRKWLNSLNNEQFKKSEFYKTYIELLNNHDFITFIRDNNFKVLFYLHPELKRFENLFFSDLIIPVLTMKDFNFVFHDLIEKSSLLITDYSSVFFDFAYLEKPIIYFQFDKEQFFINHYLPGYFKYEDDGFGPIVSNTSDLMKELDNLKVKNFSQNNTFSIRSKIFFELKDNNNSKRIFEEIIKKIQ